MGPSDAIFVPALVSLLGHRVLKGVARETLVSYGESVVPVLAHLLNDPDEHIWVRRHIPGDAGADSGAGVDGRARRRARRAATASCATRSSRRSRRCAAAIRRSTFATRRDRDADLPARRRATTPTSRSATTSCSAITAGARLAGRPRARRQADADARSHLPRCSALLYPWKDVAAARRSIEQGDARTRAERPRVPRHAARRHDPQARDADPRRHAAGRPRAARQQRAEEPRRAISTTRWRSSSTTKIRWSPRRRSTWSQQRQIESARRRPRVRRRAARTADRAGARRRELGAARSRAARRATGSATPAPARCPSSSWPTGCARFRSSASSRSTSCSAIAGTGAADPRTIAAATSAQIAARRPTMSTSCSTARCSVTGGDGAVTRVAAPAALGVRGHARGPPAPADDHRRRAGDLPDARRRGLPDDAVGQHRDGAGPVPDAAGGAPGGGDRVASAGRDASDRAGVADAAARTRSRRRCCCARTRCSAARRSSSCSTSRRSRARCRSPAADVLLTERGEPAVFHVLHGEVAARP